MSDLAAVRRVARWLMPLIGIASLLGGSVFWLRRVGWLQAEKYWYDNAELAARAPESSDPLGSYWFVMQHHASLHQIEGWWYLTKFTKEAVLASFLALAVFSLLRFRPARPFRWACAGVFALGLVSAMGAALGAQWMALAGGVRGFASWLIGRGAAAWVDEDLRRRLARVCAWVLFAQLPLAAVELLRGIPVYVARFFGHEIVRIVGSFNLPISLGSFAVVAWTAMQCWSGYSRRTLGLATSALVLLLFFNASATAWIAFVAALCTQAVMKRRRDPQRHSQQPGYRGLRAAMLAMSLPLILAGWLSLPVLTGRADVHDSLWGRIAPVQIYASEHLTTQEMLFGTGFGLGTNALGRADMRQRRDPNALPDRPVGDSMPAALFWQIGLVGLALVYALFALALRADARSRPIGIALLVCSVGVNITELFPVNLLLGFWLASAMRARGGDAAA